MYNFDGYTKLVAFENIENQSKQEVHGQNIPRSERKCIFCGNENAEFTKVAHAVSETIGNKSLISHFECDECNQNFGKMFEDDLGKYMFPYKIITKTFGKNNQLSSKDMPKEHGISYENYRIQLNRNKPVLENIDVSVGDKEWIDINLYDEKEIIARGRIELTVGYIEYDEDGGVANGLTDEIDYRYSSITEQLDDFVLEQHEYMMTEKVITEIIEEAIEQ